MRHGDVNYYRWNPEAKALLVAQLLWFVHGGLMEFNRVFALTWLAHALIVGVWGFSYLWRTGSQGHRRLMAWRRYYASLPCRICKAPPGEPCDAGLHS